MTPSGTQPEQTVSDAVLIALSFDDPQVFAEIFERHFDAIRRYAQRRVGLTSGEDIAASVFEQAFSSRRRYDPSRPNALPWLFGITSHLIGRWARDEKASWLLHERTLEEFALQRLLPDEVEMRTELQLVAQCIRRLRPLDRDILFLFAWGELSYDEIGEAMAIPIGTVRSRLHRTRRRLRELRDADMAST